MGVLGVIHSRGTVVSRFHLYFALLDSSIAMKCIEAGDASAVIKFCHVQSTQVQNDRQTLLHFLCCALLEFS